MYIFIIFKFVCKILQYSEMLNVVLKCNNCKKANGHHLIRFDIPAILYKLQVSNPGVYLCTIYHALYDYCKPCGGRPDVSVCALFTTVMIHLDVHIHIQACLKNQTKTIRAYHNII